ncbi:2-iminobutanoate/2-iminopropanoate deaminase-like [Macrosteles quadrilineatus]|uniref:2-iminobutanoate/2-iminopropanoate deaminase-like n=1 Tax=Macrosteles quadrilineatus TaxID=74068 RepID=UPI0023E2E05A|nr:2-iminobutanoate/2-iminopropanoate deaminase-like [Macrosteles quadrilineatus]
MFLKLQVFLFAPILYSIVSICRVEARSSSASDSFETADIFHRLQIYTENAPKPVGPYSQAIQFGRTVYVSAVLGLDKETKKIVPGGAEAEAKQALDNLSAILDEANTHFANVLKTTVYLHDMNDFLAVNRMYKEYFRHPYPARTTLEVSKLPLGAKVAIEAIVGLTDSWSVKHATTTDATGATEKSLEEIHM